MSSASINSMSDAPRFRLVTCKAWIRISIREGKSSSRFTHPRYSPKHQPQAGQDDDTNQGQADLSRDERDVISRYHLLPRNDGKRVREEVGK